LNPASTTFVLGYHGCDAAVAEQVFAGRSVLTPSQNDYDWLGPGVYFWEHNARRAYDFACEVRGRPHHGRPRITDPAVVGAIIDVGYCLSLYDAEAIASVRQAHRDLDQLYHTVGRPLPVNAGGPDRLLRRLDCAVIEMLHAARADRGDRPFDTVRAPFAEGGPAYAGAGFDAKSHVQLCVRTPAAVKGYFRPLDDDGRVMRFG
jgi:hypothetical protein